MNMPSFGSGGANDFSWASFAGSNVGGAGDYSNPVRKGGVDYSNPVKQGSGSVNYAASANPMTGAYANPVAAGPSEKEIDDAKRKEAMFKSLMAGNKNAAGAPDIQVGSGFSMPSSFAGLNRTGVY